MHSNPSEQPLVAEAIPTNFRDAVHRVGLTQAELYSLGSLRKGRAIWDFAITLFLILAIPVVFRLVPHFVTAIICVMVSLNVFNRLASFIHMSDHGALLPGPRANSILGSFAAFFMGYTRHGHRAVHQEHHLYLNTQEDPDKIWGKPDESGREVLSKWLADLFFLSAIMRLAQYVQPRKNRYRNPPSDSVILRVARAVRLQLPVIPVQLALIAYYHFVVGWEYYLFFYALPMLTLYPAIIRLRSTVEHSFDAGYASNTDNNKWVVRSTNAGVFERALIAPLNGEYHLEHHLLPTVPYYNLPEARRLIESKGVKVPLAEGYFSFLIGKILLERTSGKVGHAEIRKHGDVEEEVTIARTKKERARIE